MNLGQKVIGITESKGIFNDKPYNNVILHTIQEPTEGKGYVVEQIKMKRSMYDIFPAMLDDVIYPIRSDKGVLQQLVSAPPWQEEKKK